MELRINTRAVAATAVAMSMLPGCAYATGTGDYDPANYLRAFGHPIVNDLQVNDPFDMQAMGTFVNVHLVAANVEDHLDVMMRVAHLLASESTDIDADIARIVDEEFWNLV